MALGSLFKKLFGGGGVSRPAAVGVDYNGFTLYPEPMAEGGQFRVAGRINKEVNGQLREHRFIRSDMCTSAEQANELMLQKSRQFIDQMGEGIFN